MTTFTHRRTGILIVWELIMCQNRWLDVLLVFAQFSPWWFFTVSFIVLFSVAALWFFFKLLIKYVHSDFMFQIVVDSLLLSISSIVLMRWIFAGRFVVWYSTYQIYKFICFNYQEKFEWKINNTRHLFHVCYVQAKKREQSYICFSYCHWPYTT